MSSGLTNFRKVGSLFKMFEGLLIEYQVPSKLVNIVLLFTV